MEYYRLYLDYERFIDYKWNYITCTIEPNIDNKNFVNDFFIETNLIPKKSKNGMYFFVDCNDEQAMYIKIKYSDMITKEQLIDIDMEKIDVNKQPE